ncbi:YebC/PmpR family DNA-binding transcriptional regulator [bacterium endosymbiont of Bathymodiolus sp. 5 South]|jgi:YebC/PmpR family DNA-binding regulatory protein|uniref:YebC/PmpR family DNA-binding transcriptional regulator n=1 Tax=bacterium endosymbiont of Bathymodiolus sp. 5 South TaxID=1181670 RepID=UPI0010B4D6B7|nr:YebC/PmpR family DNA-binding transcriptional regulator [bacterium endosymbiont of Bathymodiolus sp. 5 South]CAC9453062.1 Probable transcriptional regulatory protein YebC [uncultured Gammaproteobacteria bacterium]CAC9456502.1 Probable transcriptional regulatory protein YebC [uncultured Gammaproteobacteria bacterium]CAC9458822.1 Probable transcriptional regulatory protein YebC [uncultured Gammaproteobacteria bacterium]SHN91702.1 Probable transcriptional regulatory protein YebC [bacterium endos
MAGHSKWHNIQHRKGAQDAKRGKIFTKLIKEIVIAAKAGGGVIENNPSLRMVIDKALAANMKRDTIESAVKRGSGDLDGDNYEEVRYEGYGLGGTAIMVDTLTDNRNRTVADVRHAFSKHGGNLGTDGSVAYLFNKQGFISFASGDEDQIMEVALDAGAQDVISNDDGSIDVITTPEDFFTVKDALTQAELEPGHAEVTMEPATRVGLNLGDAEKFMKLIERLEDLDDTQEVYHNADISDEVMAQLQYDS